MRSLRLVKSAPAASLSSMMESAEPAPATPTTLKKARCASCAPKDPSTTLLHRSASTTSPRSLSFAEMISTSIKTCQNVYAQMSLLTILAANVFPATLPTTGTQLTRSVRFALTARSTTQENKSVRAVQSMLPLRKTASATDAPLARTMMPLLRPVSSALQALTSIPLLILANKPLSSTLTALLAQPTTHPLNSVCAQLKSHSMMESSALIVSSLSTGISFLNLVKPAQMVFTTTP